MNPFEASADACAAPERLARLLLRDGLPPSLLAALDRGESVAVVVEVAWRGWTGVVARAARGLWPDALVGPSGEIVAEAPAALAEGRAVLGVCREADPLPPLLGRCADHRFLLQPANARQMRLLLRSCCAGSVPRAILPVWDNLRPGDIEAAFRWRAAPKDVVAYLSRARARQEVAPEERARLLRERLGEHLDVGDLAALMRHSEGGTGEDVEAWAAAAAAAARRHGGRPAFSDVVRAALPPETRSASVVLRTARHEAGHAAVGLLLGAQRLEWISLAAEDAAGLTRLSSVSDRPITREHLESLVVAALAGRAADELLSGAADAQCAGGEDSDLHQASAVCATMHESFGLGASGLASVCAPGEAMGRLRTDARLRRFVAADLGRLYAVARRLVSGNAESVEALARELVARRFMSGDQVRAFLRGLPERPASAAAKDTSS